MTEFIEEHDRNNKEFILVLVGDHGRYFHPLTLEALTEKLLPPSFILASKSIVERFGVHENLMHNSNILVTRHDWYATIKHFAELPYLKKAPDSFDLERFLRKKVYKKSAKNLFFQKLEENRTCESTGTFEKSCVCHNEYVKKIDMDDRHQKIITTTISVINKYIKTNDLSEFCEEILSYDVDSIQFIKKTFEYDIQTVKITLKIYGISKRILIISTYIPYPKGQIEAHNKNRLLKHSTELISDINKQIMFEDLHVYNILLKDYLEDPQLIDPDLHFELADICINKRKQQIIIGNKTETCMEVCSGNGLRCSEFIINEHLKSKIRKFIEKENNMNMTAENGNEMSGKFIEAIEDVHLEHIHQCHKEDFPSKHLCVCFE